MKDKARVAISGYYGFGNLGDESILETLVSKLKSRISDPSLEITVFSNAPEETERDYGVKSIPRWNFLRIFRYFRKADLLISGGGGLLQDKTSSKSLWYYLFIITMAFVENVPVYIVGQGIGPIDKKINKILTGFVIRRVGGFLVRDRQSRDTLIDMGIDEDLIIEGVDLALLFPQKMKVAPEIFSDGEDLMVGAALKDISEKREEIIESVSEALLTLREDYGAKIVLFSTHHSADLKMARDIHEIIGEDAKVIDTHYVKAAELIQMIDDLDFLIGGRLHALEFAILAETPVVGISYDPKMDLFVDRINEQSGHKINLWHPGDFSSREEFIEDVQDGFRNRKKLKKSMEEALSVLRLQGEEDLNQILSRIEERLEVDHGE